MDFASFYDNQQDYAGFRNDPVKRENYSVIVDWKVRNIINLIPEGFTASNILEVGCAFGVLLNNISDRLQIQSRTGIDISVNNIDAAKKLYPDCSFFQGTVEEFFRIIPDEIPEHRFDVVVLSDIVEHIPDDLEFLQDINKISSYVLLNLPLEKSFKTRKRQYGEQDPSGHLRCYDEKDAGRLVKRAGFEVIKDFTSIGFFDKSFRRVYKEIRRERLHLKPWPKKWFWSVFYFLEDRIKLINKGLTTRFIGCNYFAFLKAGI